MNKEQENLIATGLWLLIKNSNNIGDTEKFLFMEGFDQNFGGMEEESNEPCCEMPEEENDALVSDAEEVKE